MKNKNRINRKGVNMTFSDLRGKEVLCCREGVRLGYVVDIEFDVVTGCICTLYVPGPGRFCGCIFPRDMYHIPYKSINKIGPDFIVVDACLCDLLRKNKD